MNARFRRCLNPDLHSIVVWTILMVHGVLLGWIAVVNAPVIDEFAHLPSGFSHWKFGHFDLYRVNPPLMRMICTIPLLTINPKTDWTGVSDDPYARSEFRIGLPFFNANGSESFWYFTICRWAQIPVSIFGGWICYRWARDLFGKSSGLVAIVLWSFCPNTLAWGATVTPDLGATAFGVTAGYAFWRWLKAPTWWTAFVAGLSLGLAELSKSTWIVLFALWPIIWLAWKCSVRHRSNNQPPGIQLITSLLFALYLLNLGYGFENSFQRLDAFTFISRSLGGVEAHKTPGNRFRGTWIGVIPVPVPANYLKGIDVQRYDFEVGKRSYLRGDYKVGGWYHYYLYAIVVKTPLGTLFLLGLAIFFLAVRREFRLPVRDEIVLLAPALAILLLVSSQTGFNRYLRYVLPAIPFLYIFASRAGKAFEMKHPCSRILCGFGATATVIGSLIVYPHSMSYFNLAAGGPLGGHAHLLDANIDWGQDLLELKQFIDRHPEISPIYVAYCGGADPKVAGIAYEPIPKWIPSDIGKTTPNLVPGWYAVSVNLLRGYYLFDTDDRDFRCFQRFTPDAMAGYSIYIYHLTPEKIKRMNEPQDVASWASITESE